VNLLSLYCRENSSFQHNHFSGGLPEYLDDLEKGAEKDPSKLKGYRYAKGVVERYLIPYFGRRNITAIRYKDLVEYVAYLGQ